MHWPALTPNGPTPMWNGHGFSIGARDVSVLCYNENDSGWSDGLTKLHEESAGRDHYIDLASRGHALNALKPILDQKQPVVLEVGCSSGYFLDDLKQAAPHVFAIGSDYLPGPLFRLHEERPTLPLVQFDLTAAPFAENQFDAIVALNVLEHIEDHRAALSEMTRMLKPGGLAVVEVPAGPGLYDFYDTHLMHFRRYRRSDLKQMADDVGLEVLESSHLGFFLYPAFALVKKRNRWRSKNLTESMRQEMVGKQIKMARSSPVLNALMKMELAVGRLVNYPWGIRCLLTARKPLTASRRVIRAA